ncbi:MAG: hypothetical protein R3250_16705, partial [Melioribacteraceae bacterium]|nr:hypothetical protein [Melioribacteraceae bacterium]
MTKYVNNPVIEIDGKYNCFEGWQNIFQNILDDLSKNIEEKTILVVECYQGVNLEEVIEAIKHYLPHDSLTIADTLMHNSQYIEKMIYPDVTDDRIFGYMTRLNIDSFYDQKNVELFFNEINEKTSGTH